MLGLNLFYMKVYSVGTSPKKNSAQSEVGHNPAPQPTFSLWSKGQILQFAYFGPINITMSCRSIVGLWFMCYTWYFIDHPEDHSQVDSKGGDMGESIMIMENVINNTCRTFIKMPQHMEDEFIEMRTIIRCTASRGAWGSPSWSWKMLILKVFLLESGRGWIIFHWLRIFVSDN